jgi:AraC-like DNA-binding protein
MKAHYKHIQSESNLFTCVIQENKEEFDYPWHFHPEYELTYVFTSHGVRYVGNSIENFFEHDLVLLGSNLPHCWINTADQVLPAKAIVIYLKEEFFDKTWMQSSELESIRQLLNLSSKGVKFEKAVALKLREKFFKLLKVAPFERLMVLLEILNNLAHSMHFHVLCEQGFSYELNTINNERINLVYKYIRNHYHRKITLKDIASEVSMTEEYFSRYFSKIMKKSFFEFLNEYKINKACKLLIETDKQVFEICYASGFESIPFFYRQFKKFKNCQPKKYRLKYQKVFGS